MRDKIELFKSRIAQVEKIIKAVDFSNNNKLGYKIALTGKWGSGKSVLIDGLKDAFDQRENSLIIDSKCWDGRDPEMITGVVLGDIMVALYQVNLLDKTKIYDIGEKCGYSVLNFVHDCIPFSHLQLEELSYLITDVIEAHDLETGGNIEDEFYDTESYPVDDKEFYEALDILLANDDERQYVLVIDGPDRCMPHIAMEYIRIIKNLNKSLPGKLHKDPLTIICSCNLVALKALLVKVFGESYDVSQYVSTLFDININIAEGDDKVLYFFNKFDVTNIKGARFEHPAFCYLANKLTYRQIDMMEKIILTNDDVSHSDYHKLSFIALYLLDINKYFGLKDLLYALKDIIVFKKGSFELRATDNQEIEIEKIFSIAENILTYLDELGLGGFIGATKVLALEEVDPKVIDRVHESELGIANLYSVLNVKAIREALAEGIEDYVF